MVKPKIPPKSALISRELDLFSIEENADFDAFLKAQNAESELAIELHQKLLAGTKHELHGKPVESALSPKRIAEFLAEISFITNKKLVTTVRTRLKSLGIAPLSGRRGRRKGRIADFLYLAYFEKARQIIEQKCVFSRRKELQAKYGPVWNTRFKKLLESEGWTTNQIDVLTISKTPRSGAIQMTALACKVTYAAVARACRRHSKAAKK